SSLIHTDPEEKCEQKHVKDAKKENVAVFLFWEYPKPKIPQRPPWGMEENEEERGAVGVFFSSFRGKTVAAFLCAVPGAYKCRNIFLSLISVNQ
ncbi:MAG: hypothetical protein WCI20_15890, partial [bacterium]